MKFKFSINAVLQTLGASVQTLAAVSEVLPPKWKITVAAVVSILQGLSALLAHYRTPDGGTVVPTDSK